MAKAKATESRKIPYIWAVLRITLGLILLWAFMDKFIGLGFSTCRSIDAKTKVETVEVRCEKAALSGGSAAAGYLKYTPKGPLKDFYNDLSGNKVVDVLFMSGLLLIGLALTTGIGIKIAAVSGALLMLMMWSAALPPANNPILDDHIVYALVMIGVAMSNKDQVWGFGQWWQKQKLVKRFPVLA